MIGYPNWKSFNISQRYTFCSLLFPAPGSRSSHIFGGLPRWKNLWSFLCFVAITFLGSIVLTSHWPLCVHCFTSLVSFTGFYTEDEPIFCLLGVGNPASSGFSRSDATLRWDRNHYEQPFAFPSNMHVHVMTTNIQWQDGNKNFNKTIGLISKTTTLHVHHAFILHFFAIFARLRHEDA